MDISFLRAFVAVTDEASFSRAAETLHLSQPAVSKRIAALEQHYDQRLFDRVGRDTRLTEAGAALLPHARACLANMEEARRALSSVTEDVSGTLSFGTSHHIGLHRLPPVLRAFNEAYPDVDLDIHFMDSEIACQAVEQGQLELAIVTLPESPAEYLDCQIIWPDPLAVMVSNDHALAHSKKVKIEQVLTEPAVLPDERTFTHRIIHEAFAEEDLNPRIRLRTNYLETLKMLVSIGLGWSVLPISMADDDIQVLDIESLNISRRLGIVTDRRRSLSSAGLALAKQLKELTDINA